MAMAVKWHLDLQKMIEDDNPEKKSHLLVPPSLVKSSGKSRWYIKFWAYNMDTKEKSRVRIKANFSQQNG
ncbi:hypothetical protein [Arcicella lustrica]|uniref:Uncharacterized protein n=1 Tax=Arcicella lustrica TaxID=2984196 RepID=A0ABU5SJR1_9BACT|nr:hypothetical protein [Arcicella sp. DC25W]MEA5427493.1 hypothetical protein [Arcicella sp. DC25W]